MYKVDIEVGIGGSSYFILRCLTSVRQSLYGVVNGRLASIFEAELGTPARTRSRLGVEKKKILREWSLEESP